MLLGDAQLEAGDKTSARATLTADYDAALAQYGANNQWTLRTQLALVRLMMAEGHESDAQAQLAAMIPALRRNGAQNAAELQQALRSLGEVLVAEGRVPEAIASLREAVSVGEHSRDSTWELAIARERLGEALAADGGAGAHDLLQTAYTGLRTQLGAAHPETVRAQRALLAHLT
jgi:tetratricopeptide (TPR) repeat protein